MDINITLEDLRKSVKSALDIGYQAQLKETVAQLNTRLLQIAEGFDNLDEWLRKGGFLPDDWAKAQEADREALRAALARKPYEAK